MSQPQAISYHTGISLSNFNLGINSRSSSHSLKFVNPTVCCSIQSFIRGLWIHHAFINTPSGLPFTLPAIDTFVPFPNTPFTYDQSIPVLPKTSQTSLRSPPKAVFSSSWLQGHWCKPFSQSRRDCLSIDYWHYGVNYLGKSFIRKILIVCWRGRRRRRSPGRQGRRKVISIAIGRSNPDLV